MFACRPTPTLIKWCNSYPPTLGPTLSTEKNLESATSECRVNEQKHATSKHQSDLSESLNSQHTEISGQLAMKHPNDSNCLNEMRLHNAAVGDLSRFLCKLAANNYYTFARYKDETFRHPKRCHVPKLSAPPLRLRQTLVGRRLPCITQWFGLSQG